MPTGQSKYTESNEFLKRYGDERTLRLREAGERFAPARHGLDPRWLHTVKTELPRLIPFLKARCGIEFYGRILEIGAGGAWLTAELSKLPKVVEVVAMDISARLLKEQAPKVFDILNARTTKITRMRGDCHHLDFPPDFFDFVVCSSVLHYTDNIVQTLREARRVLKTGGQFVAVREPTWPLVSTKSRARRMAELIRTGYTDRFYTLADYREAFRQAGFEVTAKRVNTSTGLRYFLNQMINGLIQGRYAFIATKNKPKRNPLIQPRRALRPVKATRR